MALSDTQAFLEDLLIRWDPDLDLSDGSRAQTELIQPILDRVGIDPFDDDVATFIRERVRQVYPNLAISEADELTDTVIDPMRVILEPVTREVKLIKLRASLANIESLSDDEVDALMGNFFERRVAGRYSTGVVRIYFSSPQTTSVTQTHPASTRGGIRFFPTRPQQITADQMLLNVDGTEYYFDVNYTAENQGDEYNVEAGEIVAVGNLPTATRVRNLRRFRDGSARETSLDFAARVESTVGDKTLTAEPGIIRNLTEAFPDLSRLFVVGFSDPEMNRDVVTGGSLGLIQAADTAGNWYGEASPVDDLDADTVTPILDVPGAALLSRVGAAGSTPSGWAMTVVYTPPSSSSPIAGDFQIVEVVSDTRVRLDADEFPLLATGMTWMLRSTGITISDIPGGIALPTNADGTLTIEPDTVHIGGKTDIYAAGGIDSATAQIDNLSDESPIANGEDAQTAASDTITLNAVPVQEAATIEAGYSLVLEEGTDAGGYRILATSSGLPDSENLVVVTLTIDQTMTGTQSNLKWKVVDEIDVELTDPKDIKVEGSDLVMIAGNASVSTLSATNFLDAKVQEGDVVQVTGDDAVAGDYTVQEVQATTLTITPVPPRSVSTIAYTVFTRFEAVSPPVVQIASMELLDSAGAPVGVTIPYRDPVLALSRAYANEGEGILYDGLATLGLVSSAVLTGGTFPVGSEKILWASFENPAEAWRGSTATGVFTFSAGDKTVDQMVAEINADSALAVGQQVQAVKIQSSGYDYLGLSTPRLLQLTGGGAITILGWTADMTNSKVVPTGTVHGVNVREGDIVYVSDGNNEGLFGRITSTTVGWRVGLGPIGPVGTESLYDNVVFLPELNARIQMGHPSVGTTRAYFRDATSVEFNYKSARATSDLNDQSLVYFPDPENIYTLIPAQPSTELPKTGSADGSASFTDSSVNFLVQEIQAGDLLEILYRPITGTSALASSGTIAVSGLSLVIRLGSDPAITIEFPFNMTRQDVVDYINTQTGSTIASLSSGALRFVADEPLSILNDSDALGVLFLTSAPRTNTHPYAGVYIITNVSAHNLALSSYTPVFYTSTVGDSQYTISRYTQRISSTAMNGQLDASGLYYADIQMLSAGTGNQFNLDQDVPMEVTGYSSDGYRVTTDNAVLSYSRAEVLRAEISRTILLVGSADDPQEYVQLSHQSVQVNYDRSQLVDEMQSFVDSDSQRVVCEDILVRHLFPHYITVNWVYVGGSTEPNMQRAIEDMLDATESDSELAVQDLVKLLQVRGATAVYNLDSGSSTGRTAPEMVVLYHDEDRVLRGLIVKDFVSSVRTQRFIPGTITLTRQSPGGIR